MKQLTAGSILLASIWALSSYAADCPHTISITGKAEEKVKPDTAYVTVYATAEGILMVDAVKKADNLVEEIKAAVRKEDTVVKSISVTDVSMGEETKEYWRSDQKQEAPHPQVVRRIRLTCKPIPGGIYQVIDNAIRAGALMQIPSRTSYSDDMRSVVIYGLEQYEEAVDRVRKAAIGNAKAEAEKLAILADKKVGDIVSIGVSGPSNWDMPMRVMGMPAQFPAKYIGANPNEITISCSVSVTFELKA